MKNLQVKSGDAEYYRPEIQQFITRLSEATRAGAHGVPGVFIRPARTEDAEANYNYFVFGQRGSGKSSLLHYLEHFMKQENHVAAWIDQELFTQLSYPDVLVSCVLDIVESIIEGLRGAGIIKVSRIWFRKRKLAKANTLEGRLTRIAINLRVVKFAEQDAKIEWVHKTASSNQLDALGSVKAHGAGFSLGATTTDSSEVTSTQTIVTSKEEYLERSLVDYRKVIKEASAALAGGFVFVDDLYQIATSNQPRVLGYLHRLLKDTGLWLKIGSIRHMTNNYLASDPPVGMQARHDYLEIALDRQFNFLSTTKAFLEKILEGIASSANIDYAKLFTDGALDRLVLASGGVARDYLRLAASSIEEARERGPGTKSGSDRVSAEDVQSAAGKIAPSKLDDLRKDSPDRAEALQERVIDLTNFCRDRKSGYFLVDSGDRALMEDINALQHLRFAHLLFESETIPDRQSQRFNVYLLDLAQLSHQRAIQGVDLDGWRKRENRRSRKLVYAPRWTSQKQAVSSSSKKSPQQDKQPPGIQELF